jgi:hypothetical protein
VHARGEDREDDKLETAYRYAFEGVVGKSAHGRVEIRTLGTWLGIRTMDTDG